MSGAHRVAIIGGGFGGLYAAKSLGRAPVALTLIDRRNFHLFQPLLYQVATGGLSPGEIASPLRHVLRRHRNTEVVMGEAVDLDDAVPIAGLVERHPERGPSAAAPFAAAAPSARAAAATASAATAATRLEIDSDRHPGLLTLHQVPDLVLRLFRDFQLDSTIAHAWGPP